jgi:hypothetical protein
MAIIRCTIVAIAAPGCKLVINASWCSIRYIDLVFVREILLCSFTNQRCFSQ